VEEEEEEEVLGPESTMQYTDSGRDWTLELIIHSSLVWNK
jgi:hypothetical protein